MSFPYSFWTSEVAWIWWFTYLISEHFGIIFLLNIHFQRYMCGLYLKYYMDVSLSIRYFASWNAHLIQGKWMIKYEWIYSNFSTSIFWVVTLLSYVTAASRVWVTLFVMYLHLWYSENYEWSQITENTNTKGEKTLLLLDFIMLIEENPINYKTN